MHSRKRLGRPFTRTPTPPSTVIQAHTLDPSGTRENQYRSFAALPAASLCCTQGFAPRLEPSSPRSIRCESRTAVSKPV